MLSTRDQLRQLSPGLRTFLVIWAGQMVSRVGTAMTRFALLIWAFEQTGSATTVALLGFFAFIPYLIVSPFAGVWVDRMDRRKIMLFADLGAGVMTLSILGLYLFGDLAIWHLYLLEAITGAFEAFQIPAYSALTSVLLPKEQYTRASGLKSLAEFGSQVLAPFFGGVIVTAYGLVGVILIDLLTLSLAVFTLLFIKLSAGFLASDKDGRSVGDMLNQEIRFGFRYIFARPGLKGLVMIQTLLNFFASMTWYAILPAMILARSGNDEFALASLQSIMGIAGVIGGLGVSLWGGPKRKIKGFLFGIVVSYSLGDIPLAMGRDITAWLIPAALGTAVIPLISSSAESIWQSKVNPEFQGRVFSVRSVITQSLNPLGYLSGGLLADRLMEPAMMVDGWLTPLFGWLVGTGPGAGMALMFIFSAVSSIVISLIAYRLPAIRELEDRLPEAEGDRTSIMPSLGVQSAIGD